jgi:hypothetical protein
VVGDAENGRRGGAAHEKLKDILGWLIVVSLVPFIVCAVIVIIAALLGKI